MINSGDAVTKRIQLKVESASPQLAAIGRLAELNQQLACHMNALDRQRQNCINEFAPSMSLSQSLGLS